MRKMPIMPMGLVIVRGTTHQDFHFSVESNMGLVLNRKWHLARSCPFHYFKDIKEMYICSVLLKGIQLQVQNLEDLIAFMVLKASYVIILLILYLCLLIKCVLHQKIKCKRNGKCQDHKICLRCLEEQPDVGYHFF